MAATGHIFPNVSPSQRVYTPGKFPTREFEGLNGAVTTLDFGVRRVDSRLEMTFSNITDDEAWLIFENYDKVNGGQDINTGERDYVVLSTNQQRGPVAGVSSSDLRFLVAERNADSLRYRYESPPTITSVFPGRSTVQVVLRGYLDGATS